MKRVYIIQKCVLFILIVVTSYACNSTIDLNPKIKRGKKLFSKISSQASNVHFSNNIKESETFNFVQYTNMYNGGGVSVGDINNDGLLDLYFISNQGANKLYLNQGNFEFKDITQSAQVAAKLGWTTGASMIDINNDGYMDIYVNKSASMRDDQLRENLLFINNGDLTFTEKGREWGLNDAGFGMQAYFFDYDNDGDLDIYQINHQVSNGVTTASVAPNMVKRLFRLHSDQLYKNIGDRFVNVTMDAGIGNYSWGHSASIGDFNNDGWEDIYVCNDFMLPDNLYLNNGDGTFIDQLKESFDHISQNSMGSDIADINNDGLLDLIVAEMSPDDHVRSKSNMPSMSASEFEKNVKMGHHYQYMINTMQVNQGNSTFSETAQMSGIAKSDWSWAALLADFDEDGWNDLFVTNGVLRDLSNSDYMTLKRKKSENGGQLLYKDAIKLTPSHPINNYIFHNQKDLTFEKKSKEWGLDFPTFSSGAAYADLDNDGDLDLVINNVADTAHIYRNNSTGNSINIEFKGYAKNTFGIGTKVEVIADGKKQIKQLYLSRGYLSSVSPRLHFGLGNADKVDTVKVYWPDEKLSVITSPDLSKVLVVTHSDAVEYTETINQRTTKLKQIENSSIGINFIHQDQAFNDFSKQLLLPYKLSQQGPFISVGDVNGDGKEDFYVGGAANQSGQLFIQSDLGFVPKEGPWDQNKGKEELQSVFFDFDADNDLDLYVVSGSYEFSEGDKKLKDCLYQNDGIGNFKYIDYALPELFGNGKTVKFADVDLDGDLDLFVGGRVISGQYPLSPKSTLLINENGKFRDATSRLAPDLEYVGMVSDAIFSDFDGDGDNDLILACEWSPIQIFENKEGSFYKLDLPALNHTTGLWFSVAVVDIDQDGDEDYFFGNLGLNSKFKVGKGKEFHIYSDDFDQSGNYDIVLTNKYKGTLVPARGLQCSSEQIPSISANFTSFQSFATASLEDIYGSQNLSDAFHIQADMLQSVFLKNNGNGSFELIDLPNAAQVSPIMDFEFIDLDKDGSKEIIIVGNLYETEVETVRYDASKGCVLAYSNDSFEVLPASETGFFINGNSRDITTVQYQEGELVLVSNNSDELRIFMKK